MLNASLMSKAQASQNAAMDLVARHGHVMRDGELSGLLKAAQYREFHGADVARLSRAAECAYRSFDTARTNGASLSVLKDLSVRFHIIASLEEAAKIRVQVAEFENAVNSLIAV